MRELFAGWLVFCGLALLIVGPAQAGSALLNDCGDHTLPPQTFLRNVNAFADAIAQRASTDISFSSALSRGEDVTEQVYAAGILGRVPDCIHVDGGRNVEVHGGDVLRLGQVAAQPEVAGFSITIHGLPGGLCEAIKGAGRSDRIIDVRTEVPEYDPGPFGTCINNPVTRFIVLDRVLPEPNTAYIYQELSGSFQATTRRDLLPANCPSADFSDNCGTDGPCCGVLGFQVFCATQNPNAPQCQAARQCQTEAVRVVEQLQHRITPLKVGEYVRLLEGLLMVGRPYDRSVQNAAMALYDMSAGQLIGSDFRHLEEPRYDKVAHKLTQGVPDAETWASYSLWMQETELWLATSDFADEFGMIDPKISAVASRNKCRNSEGLVAIFSCWSQNWFGYRGWVLNLLGKNSEAGFDNFQNRIDFEDIGSHSPEVVYRTLLEELIHARQWQLVLQQATCTLDPKTDPPTYAAATVFALNNAFTLRDASDTYRNQPLEHWAKEHAARIRDILFP